MAHAWILLLSARIFADVDLGWGRSLSTVLLGAIVEGCGACLIGGLVFADGQGVSAMEWLLATLVQAGVMVARRKRPVLRMGEDGARAGGRGGRVHEL